jgi:hypothetical protein
MKNPPLGRFPQQYFPKREIDTPGRKGGRREAFGGFSQSLSEEGTSDRVPTPVRVRQMPTDGAFFFGNFWMQTVT